jgi:hypothetical protein
MASGIPPPHYSASPKFDFATMDEDELNSMPFPATGGADTDIEAGRPGPPPLQSAVFARARVAARAVVARASTESNFDGNTRGSSDGNSSSMEANIVRESKAFVRRMSVGPWGAPLPVERARATYTSHATAGGTLPPNMHMLPSKTNSLDDTKNGRRSSKGGLLPPTGSTSFPANKSMTLKLDDSFAEQFRANSERYIAAWQTGALPAIKTTVC